MSLLHNVEWVSSFFYEIAGLFNRNSDNSGSLSILLNDSLIFPTTGLGWLWGHGINLYFPPPGLHNSDIGFITQLYYGGLLLSILLFSLILYMSSRLILKFGLFNWVTIFFIFSYLIINFKSSFFASTPGSRFIFFIYILFIVRKYKYQQITT